MAKNANGAIIGDDTGVVVERVESPVKPTGEPNGNSRTEGDGPDDEYADAIDPVDAADTGTGSERTTDTGTRRRRGRPPGSRNKSVGSKGTKNLSGVEKLLLSVHSMGAMILSSPAIELSEDEARELTGAINNVSQFYPLGLSDKQLAWINLFMVAGGIYGSKAVVAIRGRKPKPAENKPMNPGLSVVQPAPAPPKSEPSPAAKTKGFPTVITNPSQVFAGGGGVIDE